MVALCRILFAGCAASSLAPAQFHSLAVTPDGETVYFSTDLPQRDSNQPLHGKIFRIGPRGLELVRSETRVNVGPFPSVRTNYYDFRSPLLGRDGNIAATMARMSCSEPNPNVCRAIRTALVAGDRIQSGELDARHGEFVLLSFSNTFEVRTNTLVELGKEAKTSWGSRYTSPWIALLSDGTVFHWSYYQLIRKQRDRPPDPEPVPDVPRQSQGWAHSSTPILYLATGRSASTTAIALADWRVTEIDGVTLVRQSYPAVHPEICRAFTNVAGLLFAACRTHEHQPEQIWRADDAIGANWRPVTNDATGVNEFALSPNARYAWFTNGRGEIKRVDTISTREEVRLGPTPVIDPWFFFSPGGINRWTGNGLDNETLRIFMNGTEAPILRRGSRFLDVLTPWGLSVDSTAPKPPPVEIRFSQAVPSAFDSTPVLQRSAQERTPQWLFAAHQNWSGVVTETSPAYPGEILHIFATGLGAVVGPVRTGEPAPLDALRPLATSLDCQTTGFSQPVATELLFAGLAPGTLGYYQVSLRLPLTSETSGRFNATVYCGGNSGFSFPVAPVAPVPQSR